MPESHSRAGKDVERMKISDEPHERYQGFNPLTGETLERGVPILTSVMGGKVVDKKVTYSKVRCPECSITAKYTENSEPVCPNCGIICAGRNVILAEQVVRDAKAAGRVSGEEVK